jgi:hypothetical protein
MSLLGEQAARTLQNADLTQKAETILSNFENLMYKG